MKKRILLAFCFLIFAIGLAACNETTSGFPESSGESNTVTDGKIQITPAPQTVPTEIELYSMTESAAVNLEIGSTFQPKEFVDENAEKRINKVIFGYEYVLDYKNSTILPRTDLNVKVYTVENIQNAKVVIDSKSGEIIKAIQVPHNQSLNTEEEYKQFINSTIGLTNNLSEYDIKCTTHFYEISDFGVRSSVVEGFHECGSNERLGTYSFIYTKSINGIRTNSHISMEFHSNGTFTLVIYDFDYDESQFADEISNLEGIKENAKNFVLKGVKDGFNISYIGVEDVELFAINEKSYVRITILIKYVHVDAPEIEFKCALETMNTILKSDSSSTD